VSTTVRYPKGDPHNPLSWDELLAKYQELGRSVLPEDRLDVLSQRVRDLESAPDVAPLWRLLRGATVSAQGAALPLWSQTRHAALTPGNVPAAGGR